MIAARIIALAALVAMTAGPAHSIGGLTPAEGKSLKRIEFLLRVQLCTRSIGYGGTTAAKHRLAQRAADCDALWREIEETE